MKIKEKIARTKVSQNHFGNRPYSCIPNINTVKTIGVIWQPTQKEAFQYYEKLTLTANRLFSGASVFSRQLPIRIRMQIHLLLKISTFGVYPKKRKWRNLQTYVSKCCSISHLEDNLVLDYITALSQARFKIGSSQNVNNYFDMNINIGENHDPMYVAKQQIFYLAQLNKK
jgi:hypothetical protein